MVYKIWEIYQQSSGHQVDEAKSIHNLTSSLYLYSFPTSLCIYLLFGRKIWIYIAYIFQWICFFKMFFGFTFNFFLLWFLFNISVSCQLKKGKRIMKKRKKREFVDIGVRTVNLIPSDPRFSVQHSIFL